MQPSGGVRSLACVALLVLGAALIAIYAIFNPDDTWWMPRCPINFLTGLQCPGCGSQRAIHALLHGNFAEALKFNALMVCVLPFICFIGVVEFNRKKWPELYSKVTGTYVVVSLMIVIAGWCLWRNLGN